MSASIPLLDVQHIGYEQQGSELLSPVSFQLNAGEQLMLTGPSGSGKSTLLKIIASLLEPTAGRLLFKGESVARLRPELYRQQVSYCFQTPALFGETVWDNLAFPWRIREKKPDTASMRNWLEKVRLSGDMLDKPIGLLSGGEKQRVALLRNLQFPPAILLLDEITSALDEENKQIISRLIDEEAVRQGAAAIWISHDKAEIERARRLITLRKPLRSENEPA
ncbi:iron efflux ABC transporter ATP-binding subunit FetA [Kalamiella sp. sgz302252]|uniref:iron efflux ABC transporter ATP-binding subunit FetA n=1 Tax=Pantoea sp. sgz302252 TaxID=3341827 RepID=UPI0036D2C1DC